MYRWIRPRDRNLILRERDVAKGRRPFIWNPLLYDRNFPVTYERISDSWWSWTCKYTREGRKFYSPYSGSAGTLIDARIDMLTVLASEGDGVASMALVAMEDRYGVRKKG